MDDMMIHRGRIIVSNMIAVQVVVSDGKPGLAIGFVNYETDEPFVVFMPVEAVDILLARLQDVKIEIERM